VGWLAERVIDAGRTTAGWVCAVFGLPEVPDAAIIPVSRGAMGSFGMLIACMLNFLQSQADVALDPHAAAGHRQHADDEISDTLARLPTPGLIAQLIDLAAPLTS
jgi:hypothetical protein